MGMALAAVAGTMHRLQMTEVFDVMTASRLIAQLSLMTAGLAVTLDFYRTRHFEGLAFAALAIFLMRNSRIPIELRGLAHSQRRVLQYVGACPADPPRDAGDSPN